MAKPPVRILQTVEHGCGYYPERAARNLVVDPECDETAEIYDAVCHAGFRRSGDLIIRPHCRYCDECKATRIRAPEFEPARRHRRNLRCNADLTVSVEPPDSSDEYFSLYARYVDDRHPRGGMDNPTVEAYESFLTSPWSRTDFLCIRRGRQLIGVAVCDLMSTGISAVYTFYEPEEQDRGLGTFAILMQIQRAQRMGLPYVYLGYWLRRHPKMRYKTEFRPIEVFDEGRWQDYLPDA